MTSVEQIIKEKLKTALDNQKKQIANTLLIPAQKPVSEAVSKKNKIDVPRVLLHHKFKIDFNKPYKGTGLFNYEHPSLGSVTTGHDRLSDWEHTHNGKMTKGWGHENLNSHIQSLKSHKLPEAFGQEGRPLSATPTNNSAMRRQKKTQQIADTRAKLQQLQQQAGKSKDVRTANAKLAALRMKLSMQQQELLQIK